LQLQVSATFKQPEADTTRAEPMLFLSPHHPGMRSPVSCTSSSFNVPTSAKHFSMEPGSSPELLNRTSVFFSDRLKL
jgi:hypothetical protein